METKIILLDLNKTLAEHISCNFRTFTYDVSQDVYSMRLINKLKNLNIKTHLVTARTDNYMVETKLRLQELCPFISKWIFKPLSMKYVPVHVFKYKYAKQLIENGISPLEIMAIESNTNTHKEYIKLGITKIYTREMFLQYG